MAFDCASSSYGMKGFYSGVSVSEDQDAMVLMPKSHHCQVILCGGSMYVCMFGLTISGTPHWESPEIKKRQKIDQKVMSKSPCDITRAPNLYDMYVRHTKW
jgi:hypothetical protein